MSRGRCRGGGGWKGNRLRVRGIVEGIVVGGTSSFRIFVKGGIFEKKKTSEVLGRIYIDRMHADIALLGRVWLVSKLRAWTLRSKEK